jgi:hypothetical protein
MIRNSINEELLVEGYNQECIICTAKVQTAIQKLKKSKNDGCLRLSSDYFISAGYDNEHVYSPKGSKI